MAIKSLQLGNLRASLKSPENLIVTLLLLSGYPVMSPACWNQAIEHEARTNIQMTDAFSMNIHQVDKRVLFILRLRFHSHRQRHGQRHSVEGREKRMRTIGDF